MNAYEYKFIHLYGDKRHWIDVEKTLNEHGNMGWKCIKLDWDDAIACCTIIFEREHNNE